VHHGRVDRGAQHRRIRRQVPRPVAEERRLCARARQLARRDPLEPRRRRAGHARNLDRIEHAANDAARAPHLGELEHAFDDDPHTVVCSTQRAQRRGVDRAVAAAERGVPVGTVTSRLRIAGV
jgi:hypothetical protein